MQNNYKLYFLPLWNLYLIKSVTEITQCYVLIERGKQFREGIPVTSDLDSEAHLHKETYERF